MTMNTNALELRSVSRSFDDFALQDISFTLPRGCILGLVGENGAGKSTTIKLIMNVLQPDRGEITVLGSSNTAPEFFNLKQDIGVVLDEATFPAVLNAKQLGKVMAGIYTRWDDALYRSYLQRFQLPEKKKFKDFSRGMKMKLAIAAALSHHPKLLILDEATSGLDPIVRDEILEIFSDFTRDPENAVLISSHIVSDLEKLCDYIAFLHQGQLLFCQEKDALLERYGIVTCTREQLADLPENAVVSVRANPYGVQALVERKSVSSVFAPEKPTMEDIILYMVKGEKTV